MTSDQLRNIVKEIQQSEGLGITDIASRAGLDRSYFSTFINSKVKKIVSAKMLGRLTSAFPVYFTKQQKTTLPFSTTPLPGTATLQDLITAKEELARKTEQQKEEIKQMYEDAKAEKKELMQRLKEAQQLLTAYMTDTVTPGLKEIIANLKEIKEDTDYAIRYQKGWYNYRLEQDSGGDPKKLKEIQKRMDRIFARYLFGTELKDSNVSRNEGS